MIAKSGDRGPKAEVLYTSSLKRLYSLSVKEGFPGGSDGKESACNVKDLSSFPGLGRSPGEGNSYPLQYSCLKKSMDRGAWQAIVNEITRVNTTEKLTLMYSV